MGSFLILRMRCTASFGYNTKVSLSLDIRIHRPQGGTHLTYLKYVYKDAAAISFMKSKLQGE